MGPALTTNEEPSQWEKAVHLWDSGKENTSRDMSLRRYIRTLPLGPHQALHTPVGQHVGDLSQERGRNRKELISEPSWGTFPHRGRRGLSHHKSPNAIAHFADHAPTLWGLVVVGGS